MNNDKDEHASKLTVRLKEYLKNHYDFRDNFLTDEAKISPLKKLNTLFIPAVRQLLNSICTNAIADGMQTIRVGGIYIYKVMKMSKWRGIFKVKGGEGQ